MTAREFKYHFRKKAIIGKMEFIAAIQHSKNIFDFFKTYKHKIIDRPFYFLCDEKFIQEFGQMQRKDGDPIPGQPVTFTIKKENHYGSTQH